MPDSSTTTILPADDAALALSSNGRYLAYTDSSGDTLYVYDFDTGQSYQIDSSASGFSNAVFSADGSLLFYSEGLGYIDPVTYSQLSGIPQSGSLFVKDLTTATPSVNVTPPLPPPSSTLPVLSGLQAFAISADGNIIVYKLERLDTSQPWSTTFNGLVVENRTTGIVEQLNSTGGGDFEYFEYGDIELSADGRYLSYEDYGSDTFVIQDLQTLSQQTIPVPNVGITGAVEAVVSSDGRYVAYDSVGTSTQVVLRDNSSPMAADKIISTSADGVVANAESDVLAISGNGDYVVFSSSATNLTPEGQGGIFVKDVVTGAVTLLPSGTGYGVFISSDGSRIISQGSNGISVVSLPVSTLTINPISGDNYVNAAEGSLITVSGTSDAIGDNVLVGLPGASFIDTADATVNADGTWSATINVGKLGDGPSRIDAAVTNDFGKTTSVDQPFTVDRTPPVATITTVAGDNIINAAELTHVTVDGTVLVTDPAGAGSIPGNMQIQIDGGALSTNFQSQASATADPQTFSQVLNATGVADGEHTITLTVVDEAGNKTVVTKQVLVDTTPPKIAIASVADDNVVGVDAAKAPVGVNGTSDAIGATVNVLVDGVQAGQAVVQADGTWLTTVSFASAGTGQHDVTAEVDDEAGNPGRADASVYVDQGFSVQQLSDGPDGEQGGGQGVLFPSLSADGTKLVFTGLNFNLMSAAIGSSGAQVYVKDLTTGAISFVTPDPSQNAEFGTISPDGRYVEFVTDANLDPNNPYYKPSLYFTYTTDLTTGATYFHYVSDDGYDGTDPDTFDPGVSAPYYDLGNYTDGTPIAPLPVFPLAIANGGDALELVDSLEPDQVVQPLAMTTQIREIVDYIGAYSDGSPLYGEDAYLEPDASPPIENSYGRYVLQEYAPAISADGSVVAFEARFFPEQWDTSKYPPPVTVGTGTVPEIYAGAFAYDPHSPGNNPPLALASSFADGTPMPLGAVDPALSADGKFVAFWSWGMDGALEVFEKNLATGALNVVSSDADGNPGVDNASGAFVGGFNTIAISADGRYVAFTSDAVLTPDDSGTGADLYVKDMQTGAITRAPLPAGTFNQNLDNQLAMRADGQYIAFVTSAGLSPMDQNNTADVYGLSLAALATPPKITIDAVAGDNRLDAAEASNQLTVSGTSDAIGQSVSLFVDGAQEFSATVANDGTWSGAIDAAQLIDGAHDFRATVASAAGATDSAGDIVTVDRVAPTFTLSTSATPLAAGQSATITVAFSEGIGNVTPGFLTATGGALSQIAFANDHTLTALFTASGSTFAVTANAGDAFDYAGNANATSATLTVGAGFDGYIVGATVRYANGSGGGVTATTDATGHFSLSGGDGSLVMTGGVDSATGLAFTGTYSAPAGSTILSPLTTLVETLVETSTDTASAANAAVVAALGLPAGTDLTTLDAVAGTLAGDATSTAAFEAGSELYDAVSLIAAAGGSTSSALDAFAADVASGGSLNLIDAATVAAAAAAANLDPTAASAIGSIVAATGAQLAAQLASATTPLAVFIDVTGASIAEQGDASAAIAAAIQAGASLAQVADSYAAGLAGTLSAADADAANNVAAACYCRGTRIRTPAGDVAIEALSIGDLVIVSSGAARPVVWLGQRKIDTTRHPDPAAVWPIVVRADAFGPDLPRRDLWLSPGHNLACEGRLLPVCALVNGVSVQQVRTPHVEYWHVELEAHDILLAEGLPAESYLDCGNRTAFANGGAFTEAYPDFRPKHWSQTCLPLMTEGPAVTRARAHLFSQLPRLGFEITTDADPHLIADGRRVEPTWLDERRLAFEPPPGSRAIILQSKTFVPFYSPLGNNDMRELGLSVARLQIDDRNFALDDWRLDAGWHECEREGDRLVLRWTRGAAALPRTARRVVIELAGHGLYSRAPDGLPLALSA